jgi:alpha-L-fucosidase
MPATYSKTSPYYNSTQWGQFLDVMINRPITPQRSDVVYIIDKIYEYRPDLLAFDLYGDPALWWVFAQRNPDILVNPLFDFRAGRRIYIPTKDQVTTDLGL